MKKTIENILIIAVIVFIILLGIGMFYSYHSGKICENYCSDEGTQFSRIIPNGEWFNTDDYCACYFRDGSQKGFYMEEKLI